MALTRDDVTILDNNVQGWQGEVWRIEISGKEYVVSAVHSALDHGDPETMVFAVDGDTVDFTDLACVLDFDHWAAIDDLLSSGQLSE